MPSRHQAEQSLGCFCSISSIHPVSLCITSRYRPSTRSTKPRALETLSISKAVLAIFMHHRFSEQPHANPGSALRKIMFCLETSISIVSNASKTRAFSSNIASTSTSTATITSLVDGHHAALTAFALHILRHAQSARAAIESWSCWRTQGVVQAAKGAVSLWCHLVRGMHWYHASIICCVRVARHCSQRAELRLVECRSRKVREHLFAWRPQISRRIRLLL